jgi:hypothetical protein
MTRFVSLFVLLAACTGTPSTTEGTTSAATTGGFGQGAHAGNGGDEGGGGAGGSGAGGSGAGGSIPETLVDRGLVARYFIDEAPSGTDPTELIDAAPDPLPLALSYAGVMTFGERDGQRGLLFSAKEQLDVASTPIAGTKIFTRLSGKTTATLEVVVAIDDASISQSRLIYVGEASEAGRFSLNAPQVDRVYVNWRGYDRIGAFVVDLGPARVVLHAVLNTTAEPEHRVRAFANGSPLPRIGGLIPGEGAGILLDGDEDLMIGNRPSGYRTPEGAIFYGAVYDVALSDEEVLRNAKALLASDDATTQ